jgi:hypothetical protein
MQMKKKIQIISILCFLILSVYFNLSIKDKENFCDTSLKQKALACEIIAEEPEDWCWLIEWFPEYYNCYEGGPWACVF